MPKTDDPELDAWLSGIGPGAKTLKAERGEKDDEPEADSYQNWYTGASKKTFKPSQPLLSDKKKQTYKTITKSVQSALGVGGLSDAVKLPPGEDLEEWIAVNTVRFYNMANVVYGECVPFCDEETCPKMSAGNNEYLWKDDKEHKRPIMVPAPDYIDLLMGWVHDQITDEEFFPVEEDDPFPENFMPRVKTMYRRMFRLYAHIYWVHFKHLKELGSHMHLNTCFKNFIYFAIEFDLISERDMGPLKNLIAKFKRGDAARAQEAR
jgi:MOB kinase activator 1